MSGRTWCSPTNSGEYQIRPYAKKSALAGKLVYGPNLDKKEAQQLLDGFVAGLKSKTYQAWPGLLGEEVVVERQGPSGVTYQIEFEAFWDSPEVKAGGEVMVSIDDGSLARFIVPLTTNFLVSPTLEVQ